MTDRIDLDEFETDEPDDDAPPRGSWFWEGEGDPDDEVDPWTGTALDSRSADATSTTGSDATTTETAVDTPETPDRAGDADGDGVDDGRAPIPRVPRTNEDRPVGIPKKSGGAGGTVAGAQSSESPPDEVGVDPATDTAAPADDGAAETPRTGPETTPTAGGPGDDAQHATASPPTETGTTTTDSSGPHGGGVDEMTLAFTYNAITRLSHLHGALADAEKWTDWIGVVGDVEAYVINKFQRDNHIDLDFFNGSGTGPGERLAEIDEHSMFYAERMAVVGVEGEDECVAETAGWEFVPLADAASKAGWELED